MNPKILKGMNPIIQDEEDISFPLIQAKMMRYETIDVEYWLNRN